MGRLIHRTAPACTYFVTTNACQKRSIFQAHDLAEIICDTLSHYRKAGNYLLHEFVLMPNHLHLLITPTQEASLEKAIQLIKGGSSFRIRALRQNKMQVWQPGFHESTVRDLGDYESKVQYIHMNPVDSHFVVWPEDWLYSSATCKYELDPMPERFRSSTSGAKAPIHASAGYVGPKGPTP